MKKTLVVSLLCLITCSPVLSQTLSPNNNKDCVVPCESLRKALVMKEEKKLLENKFQIVKDSVFILNQVISLQGELISNKDKEIVFYVKSQEAQSQIINEKDIQINQYKKTIRRQKIYKFIGFSTSTLGIVAVVLILL